MRGGIVGLLPLFLRALCDGTVGDEWEPRGARENARKTDFGEVAPAARLMMLAAGIGMENWSLEELPHLACSKSANARVSSREALSITAARLDTLRDLDRHALLRTASRQHVPEDAGLDFKVSKQPLLVQQFSNQGYHHNHSSRLAQRKLNPPVDELVRQDPPMSRLLNLPDLNNRRARLPPYPPHPLVVNHSS